MCCSVILNDIHIKTNKFLLSCKYILTNSKINHSHRKEIAMNNTKVIVPVIALAAILATGLIAVNALQAAHAQGGNTITQTNKNKQEQKIKQRANAEIEQSSGSSSGVGSNSGNANSGDASASNSASQTQSQSVGQSNNACSSDASAFSSAC